MKVSLHWQRQWHQSMVGNIFGSWANMNYERRKKRVVYHRFTAFMAKRILSREEACTKCAHLSEYEKAKYVQVAAELNEAGNKHKASLKEKMATFKGTGPLGSKNESAGYFVGVC